MERPFDLFTAVESSGLRQTTSSKIVFNDTNVICVVLKINDSFYRIDIYSQDVKHLKTFFQRLYEFLPSDVTMTVSNNERPNYVDKKQALYCEITACKKGHTADEILTDKAFHE